MVANLAYMSNITRDFTTELARRIKQNLPFLQIVLGPRQVGKTTGVLQLESLCNRKTAYFSADSPAPPTYEWIREIWQKTVMSYTDPILIIDEVQKVKGWSEVIKQLYDEKQRKQHLCKADLS